MRTACPASVPGLFQQCGKVGDVAEIVDDPVRIGLRQRCAVERRGQRHDMSGPGPACCFDPRRGVFEDDAFRRSQPQGRGGRKVNLRVGFASSGRS